MSDLERELAELGKRVSDSIRPSDDMAERVFRRARTRRVVTATTGLFLVAALVLTSFTVVEGFSPKKEQGPVAPRPTETSTPIPSPSRGRDIGLGFPVCDVRQLEDIDFLGDGTNGTAWTATTFTEGGRCGRNENSYFVAADVTGDGEADHSWGPLKHCFFCAPHGKTDFDGDGDDELVVLVAGGSVATYQVLDAETTSDGSIRFAPPTVARPGNSEGDLPPDQPLRMWAGGDEGFSANIACDGYPADPVLIVAWSNHPIEGPGSETTEIHVTRLELSDGSWHVVDSLNTEQTTTLGPESLSSLPDAFSRRGRQCGVKFLPF